MINNYTQLLGRLESEIQASRPDTQLAVLFIKLECMAKMDALMGYGAGDQLSSQAAQRLREILRESDILGQLSRDEFWIILPNIFGDGQVILAANKIQSVLDVPFEIDGRQIFSLPRIGASLLPEHGNVAENLLKRSKAAAQEANVRNEAFMFYDSAFELANRQQFDLANALRNALAENDLSLWHQPQVDLKTGLIVASEALLRWQHLAKGPVSPSHLVSVAENSGLITLLTQWVLNTALRQLATYQNAGLDITMGINFSALNLLESELPEYVDQALRTWNVHPSQIMVEITESAVIRDQTKSLKTLRALKEIGVKLSLDDFGTGYSSLSHVRLLPLDELKIDLAFVKNMLQVKADEKIVRSIIDLGHNFDLKVVAEGVEDKATADTLREMGCDRIQGYLVSPAIPEEQFIELATNFRMLG